VAPPTKFILAAEIRSTQFRLCGSWVLLAILVASLLGAIHFEPLVCAADLFFVALSVLVVYVNTKKIALYKRVMALIDVSSPIECQGILNGENRDLIVWFDDGLSKPLTVNPAQDLVLMRRGRKSVPVIIIGGREKLGMTKK
jgi:hypothetical protein